MAYRGPSKYKDNFGRWQSTVTVNLPKKLSQEAEDLKIKLEQLVADKLLEVHKTNIIASYSPRSESEQEKVEFNKSKKAEELEDRKYGIKHRLSRKKLSYRHTGILENAVHVDIDKKNRYTSRVVVKIHPDPYPNDGHRKETITATQVYEWLRKGTKGGDEYWFKNEKGERPTAKNYPTPEHPFELHTVMQMRGFLETLDLKKYMKSKKYRKE